MKAFLVLIGPKGSPRLSFQAMAPDSFACMNQHLCLVEFGERLEVVAIKG